MIICMNIGTDGERHIAFMVYNSEIGTEMRKTITKACKQEYDEVYIIEFRENEAFIDEVVLRGCRV